MSAANETVYDQIFQSLNSDEVTQLACELVDIPSRTGEELACAQHLQRYLEGAGVETLLQRLGPTRANIIGVLRGAGGGPSLMLNGHMDTSLTGDEREDTLIAGPLSKSFQFKAEVRDGCIHGLGAYNMKGGLAAAAVTLATLKRSGVRLRGDVLFSGVAGEIEKVPVQTAQSRYEGPHFEGSGYGTAAVLSWGFVPDAAVVCESSGLNVVNVKPGFYMIRIGVHGRTAYVSTVGPNFQGINAIEKAMTLIARLKEWAAGYTERNIFDAGLGKSRPNLMIGAIEGGAPFKPNFCPALCSVYIDLRTSPATDGWQVLREFQSVVADLAQADPQFKYELEVYGASQPGTCTPPNDPFIQKALAARERVIGTPQTAFPIESGSSSSDANIFRRHGVPAVDLGPRSGPNQPGSSGVWAKGERIEIAALSMAARIYLGLAVDFCGRA